MCVAEIKHQVSGRFRFEKFKTDDSGHEIEGTRSVAADWFDNLILDQGLNQMATLSTYLTWCQVGSGSTPPSVSQTALVSRIAGSNTRPSSDTLSTSSDAPYYVSVVRRTRFAEGVAAGNLAEVGMGTATSGTTLFSRALIKDAQGNPTTITILSDESLDVVYELRYYALPEDVTGNIVATGNIGGSYDYIIRNASVTNAAAGGSLGWGLPTAQSQSTSNANGRGAYTTDIGPQTGVPAGSASGITEPTALPYTSGSFVLDRLITASLAQGNFVTGLRSMVLKLGIGFYQIQFDPPIPKTAEDVVQLTLRLSWGRRP